MKKTIQKQIGLAKRVCKECDKSFEVYISKLKHGSCNFCSRKCANLDKKTSMLGKNNPMWGKKMSEENKLKMSKLHKGVIFSEERREKIRRALKGRKLSEEHKKKLSEVHSKLPSNATGKRWKLSDEARRNIANGHKGAKCNFWKGGITPLVKKARRCVELKIWRSHVFERDSYTCQLCGNKKSGNLNAHHIKKFSENILMRYNIDNGITLCVACHESTFRKENIFENMFLKILEIKHG